jgi:8-oxo-dGTP pyrophosphatase MutT (NUDIX family)
LCQQPNTLFSDMNQWQYQASKIRRALADVTPVLWDDLLIPHSTEGQIIRKMTPDPHIVPREAAALLLFYPYNDELWFPLTVRSKSLARHGGEVSLPGGATEPADDSLVTTALRETREEIGVDTHTVEVWGFLTTVYIPASNFRLSPLVGFAPAPPLLKPCPLEIAEVFQVPFRTICNPATVVVEEWTLQAVQANVPFFALNGHKVWGATALILSELLARIRRL